MNFQEYFNLKSEGLFKSETATFRGKGMSIYLFFSSSTQQELFLMLIRTKFNQIKILCFKYYFIVIELCPLQIFYFVTLKDDTNVKMNRDEQKKRYTGKYSTLSKVPLILASNNAIPVVKNEITRTETKHRH